MNNFNFIKNTSKKDYNHIRDRNFTIIKIIHESVVNPTLCYNNPGLGLL